MLLGVPEFDFCYDVSLSQTPAALIFGEGVFCITFHRSLLSLSLKNNFHPTNGKETTSDDCRSAATLGPIAARKSVRDPLPRLMPTATTLTTPLSNSNQTLDHLPAVDGPPTVSLWEPPPYCRTGWPDLVPACRPQPPPNRGFLATRSDLACFDVRRRKRIGTANTHVMCGYCLRPSAGRDGHGARLDSRRFKPLLAWRELCQKTLGSDGWPASPAAFGLGQRARNLIAIVRLRPVPRLTKKNKPDCPASTARRAGPGPRRLGRTIFSTHNNLVYMQI